MHTIIPDSDLRNIFNIIFQDVIWLICSLSPVHNRISKTFLAVRMHIVKNLDINSLKVIIYEDTGAIPDNNDSNLHDILEQYL